MWIDLIETETRCRRRHEFEAHMARNVIKFAPTWVNGCPYLDDYLQPHKQKLEWAESGIASADRRIAWFRTELAGCEAAGGLATQMKDLEM
jgi:hypothetical protein